MKIVFNGLNSGLGNNGGSRTILASQQVLQELGHDVYVAARNDGFTWFEHRPIISGIPNDADALINIAAVDYPITASSIVPKKFWWIRAHETWAVCESILLKYYEDDRVQNLVNSKGLQEKLTGFGYDSKVVYQGYDEGQWYNENGRSMTKIRIGCLYENKPRKRWKDFIKLRSILGDDSYEYVAFGTRSQPMAPSLTAYLQQPSKDELRSLYSSCDFWFAPTDSEGLHNPPIEACLCGATLVCSDHPLNGMVRDYAFPSTSLIYKFGDIHEAAFLIKNTNYNQKIAYMRDCLVDDIGDRQKNMKKFVELLK